MSQQTVGRCIREVCRAVNTILAPIWIQFPTTIPDKNANKTRFMETTGFPGSIGAIDCTHVYILKPIVEEHNYVNRRGRHSKNVQIICDYDLKILATNASHAGATYDSFIWNNSTTKNEMERNDATWLIGDSGYAQQPWLITPFLHTLPESPEERYNRAHCRARNCVERCIGVLKMRFQCINGERVLRYNPRMVGSVVNTCADLHNMCFCGTRRN
ncbi:hypothetical protein JTB14_036697 [Gonioctena quinquepunctata]|nr:hypothetical protein JTB14_036697 [Gonioctena quinquepunctata]